MHVQMKWICTIDMMDKGIRGCWGGERGLRGEEQRKRVREQAVGVERA